MVQVYCLPEILIIKILSEIHFSLWLMDQNTRLIRYSNDIYLFAVGLYAQWREEYKILWKTLVMVVTYFFAQTLTGNVQPKCTHASIGTCIIF